MMKEDVIRLNEQLKGKKAEEVLDYFLEKYQGHIALASSLGIEDQVLTAMICGIDATTRIFTLDTGRKSVGRVGRDERIDKSESFDRLDRNRGMGVYP